MLWTGRQGLRRTARGRPVESEGGLGPGAWPAALRFRRRAGVGTCPGESRERGKFSASESGHIPRVYRVSAAVSGWCGYG